MAKIIGFLRLLSIDIVLGAIGGLYFASRIFSHEPSVFFYITLASAVWVVYIFDHILDGIRTKSNSIEYQFHYKHRKILIPVGIFLVLISAYFALFHLEKELIVFGLSTFILVIIYLVLNFTFRNKNRFFPKELLISVIYTWGIFGGVILISGKINMAQLLFIFNYFLVVIANVLLFSYADLNGNKHENYRVISKGLGAIKAKNLIILVIILSIVISNFTGFYFSTWKMESLVLILMNLTLLSLILFPSMLQNKFFGFVADAVFIYPLLFYWF